MFFAKTFLDDRILDIARQPFYENLRKNKLILRHCCMNLFLPVVFFSSVKQCKNLLVHVQNGTSMLFVVWCGMV